MIRRLVVTGGARPWEVALRGTVVVGRDPACEISESNDPLLSRRHAEFSNDGPDVLVRDLSSRNGILVNGSKTSQSRLRPGDVVQIGHLQVQLLEEAGLLLDTAAAETVAAHAPPAGPDDETHLIDRASAEATRVVDAPSPARTVASPREIPFERTVVGAASALVAPSFADDDDDANALPSKRAGS